MVAVVANDGFEVDNNAQLVQAFGEVKRVRVLPKGREQLGADGDDLGVHGESLNE